MTKIPLGWPMATMLPGACGPAPHEPSLLLAHGPAEAVGATSAQPSAEPQSEPE